MLRNPVQTFLTAACTFGMFASQAFAVLPAERMLPKTTKGFVSTGNVDSLQANFEKTQLGKLLEDPIMKPFADDLREQLRRKWSQSHQKLGISWEDLKGVPAGEAALGVIQPKANEAALAMVVDVTGHKTQAEALLATIATNMQVRKAKKTEKTIRGVHATVYDLPKHEDTPASQAVFCLHDDMLLAADEVAVMDQMLVNHGDEKGSLAAVPAFAATMKKCGDASGEVKPDIRWFVEPFGYAEAMRAAAADRPKRKGQDMLKIFKNQGFTAIQGLGGHVNFSAEGYEVLHRTAIFAPPVKAGAEKYELAARMLRFPNSDELKPLPFVPRELASYVRFNIDIHNAFEHSKTLVNEIVGDEVFDDVIKSILEDPNGPQIDIRKDLVGLLGQSATVMTDYQLPITTKSERMLVAVDAVDVTKLAATIEKSMKTDPDAHRREYKGHVIWEIVDEHTTLPMVTIENNPAFGPASNDEEEEEEKRMLPNSAVTVAHGHLLVATHIDFLVKVLDAGLDKSLAEATDYQLVQAELQKLSSGAHSAQAFSRTDEEYRAVYELVRAGKMPESESMLGKLLNAMAGTGKEGVTRSQKIDGGKLPEFEAVRRYFGPCGMSVVSEDDGWFITGVVLTK